MKSTVPPPNMRDHSFSRFGDGPFERMMRRIPAVALFCMVAAACVPAWAAEPIHQHPGFGKPEPRVIPSPQWLVDRFGSETPVGMAAQLADQGVNQWLAGRTIEAEQSFTSAVLHDPELLMGYLGLALVHDRFARHAANDGRTDDHEMHRSLARQALGASGRYVDDGLNRREATLFHLVQNEWIGKHALSPLGPSAWQAWIDADPSDRWRPILRDRWLSSVVPPRQGGHSPQMEALNAESALEQSSIGWTHAVDVPGWTAAMIHHWRELMDRGRYRRARDLAEALIRMPRPIVPPATAERSDYRWGHALAAMAALSQDVEMDFGSDGVAAAVAHNLTSNDVAAVQRDWKAALFVAAVRSGNEASAKHIGDSLIRQGAMNETSLLAMGFLNSPQHSVSNLQKTRGQWMRVWTSDDAEHSQTNRSSRDPESHFADLAIAKIHSPKVAPSWGVRDADGGVVFADQYADRPLLMLFYLGAGCLHCVQQVQAFERRYDDLAKAGIEVIAISSESVPSLRQSLDAFGERLRIPLLSNVDGEVFDAFGCIDSLTGEALHGTFFIMPGGRVGFWDIGVEPVLDVDGVLAECQRQQALFRFDGPHGESIRR